MYNVNSFCMYLQHNYTWEPALEWQVRRAFNSYARNRLRGMFYSITHNMGVKKPGWVTEDVHKQMMEILKTDKKFMQRSVQNRMNRRGGSMENEIEPTHFQGSISSVQHAKKLVSSFTSIS